MADRKRRRLDVDNVLDMIESLSDSSGEDSDEDDIPLAQLARGSDSDNEPSLSQLSDFDDDELDNAPALDVPGDVYNAIATDENGWSANLNDRSDSNVRFRNFPGISDQTVADLGGRETMQQATPGSLFQLFFSDGLLGEIVMQTNLYAQQERQKEPQKHKAKWTNITLPELKTWFGILFAMGLILKGNLRDYWTTDWMTETPGFRKAMARDRFLAILRYIHIADNSTAITDRNDPHHDKLFKIRPVLDEIVSRCKSVYNPEREIAIDESMIACKSRFGFKQFMRDKPIRWGIKVFMLSESTSGFILNFHVYTGKELDATDKGATHDVVMRVCNPFLNVGHHLFMDNFYTSVPLFENLLRNSTLACGTVRSNRKGLPTDSMNAKSQLVKGLQRGSALYRYKDKLTAITWKDNKAVTILTSMPFGEENDNVERSVKVNGKWEKTQVNRPLAVANYNSFMGGVDLSDQRINSHKRLMGGVVWYLKIFWYLLDVAKVNSMLLHEKITGKKMKMKDFSLALAKELIGDLSAQQLGRPATLPECIRTNSALGHAPSLVPDGKRSRCVVHQQRVDTKYVCRVCAVRLCPAPCFYRYHNMRDYLYNDPNRPNAPKHRKNNN